MNKINKPGLALITLACLLAAGCEQSRDEVAGGAPDASPEPQPAVVSEEETGPGKPNILLIMADDLGWGDVGFNGSEIRTPNLDRLASEGVRLDRYYTHPTCGPTRVSLFSGRHALSLGMSLPLPPWSAEGVPPGQKLLPEYLKEAGYATWLVGKWHLGHHYQDQMPHERGFDYFYGTLGGQVNYYTHVLDYALDWQRNGSSVEEEGYATDLLTEDAIRLIEEHDGEQPWFMFLSYTAPHEPLQAPEEAIQEYAHIEDDLRRRLAAMITVLDDRIGQVIDMVSSQHDADNTVVIFISDNGGEIRAGASNGDLRGGKMQISEGGIRVPALVWWPGRVEPRVEETFVSVHDLMPTILGLAGGAGALPEEMAGQDIWPLISEGGPFSRQRPIVLGSTMRMHEIAAIDDGYKLIHRSDVIRNPGQGSISFEYSGTTLYNVVDDPAEEVDLAEAEPGVVTRLQAAIDQVPVAEIRGAEPPPPDWMGATGPSPEPTHSEPLRPAVAESVVPRP